MDTHADGLTSPAAMDQTGRAPGAGRLALKLTCLFLPFVAIMIPVCYFGDAGGLFTADTLGIARILAAGRNVTNVQNIDERSLQRSLIEMRKTAPSTIVLGSSRIMLVGSDCIPGGGVVNHGVSGASLEDLVAIYQMYHVKSIHPQRVVIGVDPWIFNERSGQVRWRTLQSEYEAFTSASRPSPLASLSSGRYLQLLSPSYFQSSLKTLRKGTKSTERSSPVATDVRVNDGMTRLADGTLRYDAKTRNLTQTEVDRRAQEYIATDVYSLENYTGMSPRYVSVFESLITHMQAQGITVDFVLMPYHPLVHKFLVTNVKYTVVDEFDAYIRSYAAGRGIPVIGDLNPVDLGMDESHFYDGMHLNEDGVARVFAGGGR